RIPPDQHGQDNDLSRPETASLLTSVVRKDAVVVTLAAVRRWIGKEKSHLTENTLIPRQSGREMGAIERGNDARKGRGLGRGGDIGDEEVVRR
ncbi:hypothetical protein, partial [Bifidobacterium gallicum]|uniref:hypothetical protein n=1 Tax=Bifidobacterium gallicum TaxID=78342 RepID=UPI0005C7A15F